MVEAHLAAAVLVTAPQRQEKKRTCQELCWLLLKELVV